MDKNGKFIVDGSIILLKNPLTADWFLFAKLKDTGEDVSIHGGFKIMVKDARVAIKKNKITQKGFNFKAII